jgi:hypothetical protein
MVSEQPNKTMWRAEALHDINPNEDVKDLSGGNCNTSKS